ncbi:MAG: TlyA family RNA methyltransferase [Hyphomicrobiales bacterium]|nr:TlyA family RNA methyltransferase [Hyphomicrobiales bacterium]
MTKRVRIDRLLVERGLFESRAKAQEAIAAGQVTADGIAIGRPAQEVSPQAVLAAAPAHPWVSRGGLKLVAALDRFGIDPSGRVCLDVGASTGGFSQVLIARGARCVYAVDVGRSQLHASLRQQPKLILFEATDIRRLERSRLTEPPDLVTVDVSFCPLRSILPAALALAQTRAEAVVLVKPQFEAGPGHVRKGVVRDPLVHARVCRDAERLIASLGWSVLGLMPSPIAGGDGNQEFLIAARRG